MNGIEPKFKLDDLLRIKGKGVLRVDEIRVQLFWTDKGRRTWKQSVQYRQRNWHDKRLFFSSWISEENLESTKK